MKTIGTLLIVFVVVFLFTVMAGSSEMMSPMVKTIQLPDIKTELKPGPGMEATSGNCRVCHSLDYIPMQPKFGQAKWDAIVTKMIKVFGAPIQPDTAKEISAYLGSAYGTNK